MADLTGRTALVTGASRGIGRAIAQRLAADGARVAVHYGTNDKAAEECVAAIGADRAFAVGAELSEPDAVETLLARVDEEFDGLDILVNNAAIPTSGDLERATTEEFDRIFAVNVRAPFFLIQQALPRMRDGGRIINIGSVVSTHVASPELITYAMSKGALDVLGRTLAKMLGPRGITVNTVAPGVIATDANAVWLQYPEVSAAAARRAALGRVGEPRDVADVVAFLASEDARWITGDTIEVSGGINL